MMRLGCAALGLGALALADDDRTVLAWTRSTEGCGEDINIPNAVSRVVWATGRDAPKTAEDDERVNYHAHRGAESLFMRDKDYKKDKSHEEPGVKHFEVGPENAVIPADALNDPETDNVTSYICGLARMPEWLLDGKKRHIVKTDIDITPGNYQKVHHVIMYACNAEMDEIIEANPEWMGMLDKPMSCHAGNHGQPVMPNMIQSKCKTLWAGYAIGGMPTVYPPAAGLPIGRDYFQYFFWEYHYDNYDQKETLDSSKMQIWYTEELRPNDLGVFMVGDVRGISIPARETAFVKRTTCRGRGPNGEDGCLSEKVIGEDGIHITHTLMHSHLAGRALYANVVDAAGDVQKILGEEHYYDFNLQSYVELPDTVHVKPGQSIDVTCIFNTEDRDGPTPGGIGTRQEMCLGFFAYYPRKDLWYCRWYDDEEQDDPELLKGGNSCEMHRTHEIDHFQVPGLSIVKSKTFADLIKKRDQCAEVQAPRNVRSPDLSDVEAFLQGFERHARLSSEGQPRFDLYWTFHKDHGEIDFAVDAATANWIGLGFSPNGDMKGADMVMGWVTDDGDVHMTDRFATSHRMPKVDDTQSIWSVAGGRFSSHEKGMPVKAISFEKYQDYCANYPAKRNGDCKAAQCGSYQKIGAIKACVLKSKDKKRVRCKKFGGYVQDGAKHCQLAGCTLKKVKDDGHVKCGGKPFAQD